MRTAITFGVTLLMMAPAGCATSTSQGARTDEIPDRMQLERRVESYAAALFAEDYRTQYEMMAPHMRRALSFAQWKRDRGVDESQAPQLAERLISARLAQAHHCSYYQHPAVFLPLLRCILSVELVLIGADGREQTEEMDQMWEYHEGEWYFGFPLH